MSKRKPLPYAAMQLRDEAIMCNANIAREIKYLMSGEQFTAEEAMRRLGMALHFVHESTSALKEIERIE